jgi:hypothetical protein
VKTAIRVVSILAVLPVLYSAVTMTMLYTGIYTQYGGLYAPYIARGPISPELDGNGAVYTDPYWSASVLDACLGLPLVVAAGILGIVDAIRRRRRGWMVTLLLVPVLAALVGFLVLPHFSNGPNLTIIGPGLDVTVLTAPLTLAGVVAASVSWFVLAVVPSVALAYSFWPALRQPLPNPPPLGTSQPIDVT